MLVQGYVQHKGRFKTLADFFPLDFFVSIFATKTIVETKNAKERNRKLFRDNIQHISQYNFKIFFGLILTLMMERRPDRDAFGWQLDSSSFPVCSLPVTQQSIAVQSRTSWQPVFVSFNVLMAKEC